MCKLNDSHIHFWHFCLKLFTRGVYLQNAVEWKYEIAENTPVKYKYPTTVLTHGMNINGDLKSRLQKNLRRLLGSTMKEQINQIFKNEPRSSHLEGATAAENMLKSSALPEQPAVVPRVRHSTALFGGEPEFEQNGEGLKTIIYRSGGREDLCHRVETLISVFTAKNTNADHSINTFIHNLWDFTANQNNFGFTQWKEVMSHALSEDGCWGSSLISRGHKRRWQLVYQILQFTGTVEGICNIVPQFNMCS